MAEQPTPEDQTFREQLAREHADLTRAIPASTHQPERVIVGNCPDCGRLCVVLNDREAWPLVVCACGWHGPTTAIDGHYRAERVMPWEMFARGMRP